MHKFWKYGRKMGVQGLKMGVEWAWNGQIKGVKGGKREQEGHEEGTRREKFGVKGVQKGQNKGVQWTKYGRKEGKLYNNIYNYFALII